MSTATYVRGHTPPPILEIPIFNRSSLLPAIDAGCRRIELNAAGSYAVGGTTPSLKLVREVSADLGGIEGQVIPLRIMIRPRGGDFVYTEEEQAQIQASIAEIRPLLDKGRGDGFVFGALLPERPEGSTREGGRYRIHWELCSSVLRWCEPFPVVFHRAFDEVVSAAVDGSELESQVDALQRASFRGLLTSGGPGNARDNLAVVKRIAGKSDGLVEIIVGGGVRSSNLRELHGELGAKVVYHSSCLSDPDNSEEVDVEEVRRIVSILHEDVGPAR